MKKSCGISHYFKVPISAANTEMRIWYGMIERCYNEKHPGYKNYGGRGIRVCKRWRDSFEQFLSDMEPRPSDEYSIDRYPDFNGDYEPDNCRWATRKQQSRNMRQTVFVEIDGKKIALADHLESSNLDPRMVRRRLQRGWDVAAAVTVPSRQKPK